MKFFLRLGNGIPHRYKALVFNLAVVTAILLCAGYYANAQPLNKIVALSIKNSPYQCLVNEAANSLLMTATSVETDADQALSKQTKKIKNLARKVRKLKTRTELSANMRARRLKQVRNQKHRAKRLRQEILDCINQSEPYSPLGDDGSDLDGPSDPSGSSSSSSSSGSSDIPPSSSGSSASSSSSGSVPSHPQYTIPPSIRTVYVDPDISGTCTTYTPLGTGACDVQNGTALAYGKLQIAVDSALPGDKILIREGVYKCQTTPAKPFCFQNIPVVDIRHGGTEDAWISIENYGDERVLIDSEDYHDIGFKVSVPYILLRGLEATASRGGSFDAGGFLVDRTHHVVIEDCKSHDHNITLAHNGTAPGFGVHYSEDVWISYSTAYHTFIGFDSDYSSYVTFDHNLAYENWNNSGNSDGLGSRGSDHLTITYNVSHDNGDDGIDMHSSIDSLIAYNVVFGNGHGPDGLGNGGGIKTNTAWAIGPNTPVIANRAGNIDVLYNVAFNNLEKGFTQDCQNGRDTIFANRHYHNIAYKNGFRGFEIEGDCETFSGTNIVKNNISYLNGEVSSPSSNFAYAGATNTLEMDYNLIQVYPQIPGLGAHNIYATNPLFSGSAELNIILDSNVDGIHNVDDIGGIFTQVQAFFNLQTSPASSPAINSGALISEVNDAICQVNQHQSCKSGSAPDMGAYELLQP